MRPSGRRGFAVLLVLALLGVVAIVLGAFIWASGSQHQLTLKVVRTGLAHGFERAAAVRSMASVNTRPWPLRFYAADGPGVEPASAGVGMKPARRRYTSREDPMRESWVPYERGQARFDSSIGDETMQQYEIATEAAYQGETADVARDIEYSQGLLGPSNRDGTALELGFSTGGEGVALDTLAAVRREIAESRHRTAGPDGDSIDAARAVVAKLPGDLAVARATERGQLPAGPPAAPTKETRDEADRTIVVNKRPFEAVAVALEAPLGADDQANGQAVDCPAVLAALAACVAEYNRGTNDGLENLEPLLALVNLPRIEGHREKCLSVEMARPRPARGHRVGTDNYEARLVCSVHRAQVDIEKRDFLAECARTRFRVGDEFFVFRMVGCPLSTRDGSPHRLSENRHSALLRVLDFPDPGQGWGTGPFHPEADEISGFTCASSVTCGEHFNLVPQHMRRLRDYNALSYLNSVAAWIDGHLDDPNLLAQKPNSLVLQLKEEPKKARDLILGVVALRLLLTPAKMDASSCDEMMDKPVLDYLRGLPSGITPIDVCECDKDWDVTFGGLGGSERRIRTR
ncbi:MAG: hypothetical protein HY303_13105 [Candidatus Wallbacteria bacterium]|nr:hypothetical protein [Candidatus Wallbacteria bacterium]